MQLNLCNIFSILPFSIMTPNGEKLALAVTFMKDLASIASVIFLQETLIWNKTTFPASNSLNLAGQVVNEFMRSISKKNY